MPEWLKLEQVWNEKWLNKTYGVAAIKAELGQIKERISGELVMLENIGDFAYEATEIYKTTLDVSRAVQEGKRLADMQKRKEEEAAARKAAESAKETAPAPVPIVEPQPAATQPAPAAEAPQTMWIKFEARLTMEQAVKLRAFMIDNGIEFRKA